MAKYARRWITVFCAFAFAGFWIFLSEFSVVRWQRGKICKKVLERIEYREKLIENTRNKIYDVGFNARTEKIAIIIPYRDRFSQLREFIQHMIQIWQRQNLNYSIYVIEQKGDGLFNRGKLLNVGFKEALKDQDYDCFIFHDVDIFLENLSCSYSCHPNLSEVNHISAFLDKYEYQHRKYKIRCPPKEYPHEEIDNVGGILMMRQEQFQNANGFSNMFWGWGGEDDDFYLRIWRKGLTIHEDPSCTFCMLNHSPSEPNPLKHRLLNVSFARQEKEGLNSLKYEVFSRQLTALYTKVTVNIGSPSGKLVEILNQKRKGKDHCDGNVLLGPGIY